MKITYVTLFLIFFLSPSQLLTNSLSKQTSPYLLQHADNPVNWIPWSKAAFQKAKKENKPIFLSIGYSTCHWCHIMERESFSNKKIAALLNKYFISIKVDREELSQVDMLYQKIYKNYYNKVGGWPLNVFLTPNREPFFITNYIPPVDKFTKEGFENLLPKLHAIYKNNSLLERYIDKITQKKLSVNNGNTTDITIENLVTLMKSAYQKDTKGFGENRQFPEASKLTLMLDLSQLSHDKSLKNDFFEMLDVMALGGLYDHVNGGFFRYCVDSSWEIPHFEKMLYTQAELIPLYVKGYILKEKNLYKDVINETITMLSRRFEQNNLYFSASDADSKGEEGAFFTFKQEEIQKALKNNPYARDIEDAMEFSFEGNFHNRVHINFYTSSRPKGFQLFQKELQKIVQKRQYPFIDKKINTAWNAMMIESLFSAAVIDVKYAKKAEKHLDALQNMMFDKGELYHQTIFAHKAVQKGLLEDYAFFIGALIAAYEFDFDQKHLLFAEYLFKQAKEKFYRDNTWYLSDDDLNVKADLNDKYYISARSKILQDIMKLAAIKESFEYERFVHQNIHKEFSKPAMIRLFLMQKEGIVLIKSSKKNLVKHSPLLQKIDYPYILLKDANYDDYLACSLHQCFAKEASLTKLIKSIEEGKK